jgi:hypothetical protein
MDSSGDLMPLPDAKKKSPRVYTNLQNIDLDSITFAQVQSTGNPIAVEEMNEDEMRRLVLVNLARLVCAGEWSGLLTAGGGGDYNPILPQTFISATYPRYVVNSYPPWGSATTTTQSLSDATYNDECFFYPFLAPQSGDVSELGVEITSASSESNDIQVGIYSTSDPTGAPDTLLGKGVFDSESTGEKYDTSLTATVTLVKGTMYWIGLCRSTTAIAVGFRGISRAYQASAAPYNGTNINGKGGTLRLANSDLSLPASSITLTDFIPYDLDNPAITLKIT